MSDTTEFIIDILNRGNKVQEWPDDEAAAYRDNGGWKEGMAAVDAIRVSKIIAAVSEEVIIPQENDRADLELTAKVAMGLHRSAEADLVVAEEKIRKVTEIVTDWKQRFGEGSSISNVFGEQVVTIDRVAQLLLPILNGEKS